MSLSRRKFLASSAAAVAGSLLMKSQANPPPASKPNLLFIMTDQQFADVIGGLNRVVDPQGLNTPAMNRLLANGVRFDHAYATYPLCVPCRNSMMTGRFPHEIDVNINQGAQNGYFQVPMMGTYMTDAGYDCGYVGKWHLAVPNSDQASHGFPFVRHAVANGIDDDVAPACRDFLDQWDGQNPFCLVASWVNPHDICEFARIEGGIPDTLPNGAIGSPPADVSQLPPLRANHAEAADEPAALKKLRENPENLGWLTNLYPTDGYTDENWRRYMWAYHRMVEKVDAEILSLLQELDQRNLTDNTIIVFTSDHGDGYGSHLWNQKICFYEESARVPFIVSGPGVGSGAADTDHIVSIGLDVIPTLLDFAGAAIPEALPGQSVKPLVEGHAAQTEWRDYAVLQCEFGGFGVNDQSGIKGRCVRSAQYKYILYHDPADPDEDTNEQLFHLPSDPGEMNNLARHADHQRELHRHRRMLLDHAQATNDTERMPFKESAYLNLPEGDTHFLAPELEP